MTSLLFLLLVVGIRCCVATSNHTPAFMGKRGKKYISLARGPMFSARMNQIEHLPIKSMLHSLASLWLRQPPHRLHQLRVPRPTHCCILAHKVHRQRHFTRRHSFQTDSRHTLCQTGLAVLVMLLWPLHHLHNSRRICPAMNIYSIDGRMCTRFKYCPI